MKSVRLRFVCAGFDSQLPGMGSWLYLAYARCHMLLEACMPTDSSHCRSQAARFASKPPFMSSSSCFAWQLMQACCSRKVVRCNADTASQQPKMSLHAYMAMLACCDCCAVAQYRMGRCLDARRTLAALLKVCVICPSKLLAWCLLQHTLYYATAAQAAGVHP